MDKPTSRTLYGVFALPVRLYGDLTPKHVDAIAYGAATQKRRSHARRRGWAFALPTLTRRKDLKRSRLVPQAAKR